MKHNISVLWVDDRRNPLKYLKKKPEPGNRALTANLAFYHRFFKKYDPKFTWVKSFDEFKDYITKNGLPDFVSFDRDLGNGPYNGEMCASWLVNYCNENGLRLPDYYPHTANRKGKQNIIAIMNGRKMKINESDIKEAVKSALNMLMERGVFADRNKIDTNKKTIGLTYNTSDGNNKGNALVGDNLKTDRMDDDAGSATYDVTLKNGFKCYNITDIKGLEVMHYFKRRWESGKDTFVNVKDTKTGESDQYKLEMKNQEWERFFNRFKRKVGFVVDYHLNRLERENNTKINGLSIYPVPSTSNFNQRMAEELQKSSLNGLGVQVIPAKILEKDLRNLEKDTDFIEKNRDFYSSRFSTADNKKGEGSVENALDISLAKFREISKYQKENVNELNELVDYIRQKYQSLMFRNKGEDGRDSFTTLRNMAISYGKYIDKVKEALDLCAYVNGERNKINFTSDNEFRIIRPKTNSKGRNGDRTLLEITSIIYDWARKLIFDKNNIRLKKADPAILDVLRKIKKTKSALNPEYFILKHWEAVPFQIKNLSNGERMGVKGIYNPSEDEELIRTALEKAKGTAVVVFDDNVSGGATLSDVCLQLSKLGFENIIPITFGRMPEKWTLGAIKITSPKNGFNLN